jgi:histidinol-phosphate phosphatase family protein
MSRAGVLLDRDGTIIVDHGYVGSVERVDFIDGAAEAIARLNAADVPVAVCTNQGGVARGLYSIEDMDRVHAYMAKVLADAGAHVDVWLSCPYHPDGTVEPFARVSADRKPMPGMAQAAAQMLDLDLGSSWVVGDSLCDVGFARAVGAHLLYVGPDGHATGAEQAPSLAVAVDRILLSLRSEPVGPTVAAPVPTFPFVRYDRADAFAHDYGTELARAVASVDRAQIAAAAQVLNAAHDRDGAVFACGNGGSASIANHLQCDHVKGVRTGTDLRARVHSLSTNIEIISAVANDIGYESVFEYQLESYARPGDVLVVVSSSGRSPNIVRALEWAQAHGMRTVALTGFAGFPARELADVTIHVDSSNYGVVEDAHQACMHLLAQYVRQSRMTPAAVASTVF